MLSGEIDANDDASRAYRDALLDMRNHYGSTGDDEEDSLKHTSKVLDGIIDGEITEVAVTEVPRFTGFLVPLYILNCNILGESGIKFSHPLLILISRSHNPKSANKSI